mmetsp:Transcript_12648/g.19452  ORF Transcript_12648/g.19452 Transcript_12648/m.19452 type:complete len:235 (-) Transcript_12648:156-860(-)
MRDVHHRMVFSEFIGRGRALGTTPIGSFDGDPVFGFRIEFGGFQLIGTGQERNQHKGPTILFGFCFVIGSTDKFTKLLIRDEGGIQKVGIDVYHFGGYHATIQLVRFEMTKGFGTFLGHVFVTSFEQDLFPCFGIAAGKFVDIVMVMQQILFFDILVGLVKGCSKDVFQTIVVVFKSNTFSGSFIQTTHVNHTLVIFVVGIGMRFEIGTPLLFVIVVVIIILSLNNKNQETTNK